MGYETFIDIIVVEGLSSRLYFHITPITLYGIHMSYNFNIRQEELTVDDFGVSPFIRKQGGLLQAGLPESCIVR